MEDVSRFLGHTTTEVTKIYEHMDVQTELERHAAVIGSVNFSPVTSDVIR